MNNIFEIYNKKIIGYNFDMNNLILYTDEYNIKFKGYIILLDDLNLLLNESIKYIKKNKITNKILSQINNNILKDEEIIYPNYYEIIFNNSSKTLKIISIFNNNEKNNLIAIIKKK